MFKIYPTANKLSTLTHVPPQSKNEGIERFVELLKRFAKNRKVTEAV